jgi:hypothetical protein
MIGTTTEKVSNQQNMRNECGAMSTCEWKKPKDKKAKIMNGNE